MNKKSNVQPSLFSHPERAAWAILLLAGICLTGCGTARVDLPSPPVASAPAHAETIVLREGDTLNISFPTSPALNNSEQIQRDGNISLPLIGDVPAAGLTLDKLRANLVKLYEPQISSKEILVALQSSSFPVYLTGYVLRPGKITSAQPITVLEAVMEVGVDYTTANLKAVRVIRRENGVSHSYVLNLKLILDGKDTEPFYLKPEDVVYVPEKFSLF